MSRNKITLSNSPDLIKKSFKNKPTHLKTNTMTEINGNDVSLKVLMT